MPEHKRQEPMDSSVRSERLTRSCHLARVENFALRQYFKASVGMFNV
ncbi:hypothetical protein ACP_1573 [Acidobacterium capsulatum ATCC 51196]|uniref:Uncharacterized protein n=1 Tax=Acidobacterium capsulatum (strain ATCC 51196 / DSM 11244 / BCRC 80197 / JCM 7670 / NBRC 15755 / NCIMB 13165 / 161) TaxID=240015 RepID=C1F6R5_ACIC5|nr:hypothetical protein ACP_1573 [Acidobacterium capsulatum ATCC 51196]